MLRSIVFALLLLVALVVASQWALAPPPGAPVPGGESAAGAPGTVARVNASAVPAAIRPRRGILSSDIGFLSCFFIRAVTGCG